MPPYRPPLACNILMYLQDMNDVTGQLRVVEGSHIDASPVPEVITQPLPNEVRQQPHSPSTWAQTRPI